MARNDVYGNTTSRPTDDSRCVQCAESLETEAPTELRRVWYFECTGQRNSIQSLGFARSLAYSACGRHSESKTPPMESWWSRRTAENENGHGWKRQSTHQSQCTIGPCQSTLRWQNQALCPRNRVVGNETRRSVSSTGPPHGMCSRDQAGQRLFYPRCTSGQSSDKESSVLPLVDGNS